MKIVLTAINAKYIHSNLAVYSLNEYYKKNRENQLTQVEIAEYTINQQKQDILSDLYIKHGDVYGFSCYIWNIDYVLEISRELKKILPDIQIWYGGPEVSYDGELVLERNPFVDLVMLGEGEVTFKKLADLLTNKTMNEKLDSIDGIVYRKENKIIEKKFSNIINMDSLPFVYEDMEKFKNKIVYYESSRGCPFSCSYCLSSIDKTTRFRSLELVFKELLFFIDNNIPQVKFIDRTFNCNKNRAIKIWNFINEHDNKITNFHFEISADLIGNEEIEIFKKMRPGLIQLEIGLQSINKETLKEINRAMDIEQLEMVVLQIEELGNIHEHLDLIAGLPYEDINSFKESFNYAYKLKPNQLQLGFLKVLKGSKMFEMKEKYGLIYQDQAPYEVMATKWISYDDIITLKSVEEMLEVYYNSSQFKYSLKYIMNFFAEPYDFYKILGDYYIIKNYNKMQHKRLARYEILLEFVKDKINIANIDVLIELMTYDIYLREDLKSRPEWMKNNEKFKRNYSEFYKENKEKSKLMHIETITIDLHHLMQTGEIRKKLGHVLFDYSNRSKLTNEAKIIWLEL